MNYTIGTMNQPCALEISIRSLKSCTVHIQVTDRDLTARCFMDRLWNTAGDEQQRILVPMPISPKVAFITITLDNMRGARETDYFQVISIRQGNITTYKWIDGVQSARAREFMDFIQRFAYNACILKCNPPGEWYCSRKKTYRINYVQEITDLDSDRLLPTPARINIYTKIIDFSRAKSMQMTVPGLIAVGCHEWAHLFENHVPEDEMEADINGITLYLAYGYPRIEVLETYYKIFYSAPSQANVDRYKAIENFVNNFETIISKP